MQWVITVADKFTAVTEYVDIYWYRLYRYDILSYAIFQRNPISLLQLDDGIMHVFIYRSSSGLSTLFPYQSMFVPNCINELWYSETYVCRLNTHTHICMCMCVCVCVITDAVCGHYAFFRGRYAFRNRSDINLAKIAFGIIHWCPDCFMANSFRAHTPVNY